MGTLDKTIEVTKSEGGNIEVDAIDFDKHIMAELYHSDMGIEHNFFYRKLKHIPVFFDFLASKELN